MTQSWIFSIHSPVGPIDLHVDTSFRSHHIRLVPLKPETLFKIFWTHVRITRDQPRVSDDLCSHHASVTYLPSARNTPGRHADLLVHLPRLGNSSFVAWDRFSRFFFCSHDCSQVPVNRHKDSSQRVLAVFIARVLNCDSRSVCCKSPSLLGF